MEKLIPYGISNFERLVEGYYYVDKTAYIEKLERINTPVFLRPRRFGKSLFTEMLRWYYDIKAKDKFEKLFANLYIGKNPTPRRNSYFFLGLDFSGMSDYSYNDKDFAGKQFNSGIMTKLVNFLFYYAEELGIDNAYINDFEYKYKNNASGALEIIDGLIAMKNGRLYVVIDEYDALTNAMAIHYIHAPEEANEYLNITRKGGFFRSFFETIKKCTKSAVEKVYITGILPITISDMNSGFNIAEWITHDETYTNMLGITESEIDMLLDEIYDDYKERKISKNEVKRYLSQYYNGYKFSRHGEKVYNPMMTMYFLKELVNKNTIPDSLADQNIRVQYNQVAYIFGKNNEKRDEVLLEITERKALDFSVDPRRQFDLRDYKSGRYINECLYHLGLLTYSDRTDEFVIPNIVTFEMILSYFERIKDFEIPDKDINSWIITFKRSGDITALLESFFNEVIREFPGDFFKDVNESFYRGLLFHVLYYYLPKNLYEVLPEFPTADGNVDIMARTLPAADVDAPFEFLMEIKRVPKSASQTVFDSKFNEAKSQVKKYQTGEYKYFTAVAVCFRGNKDYKIDIEESLKTG
ncbi:MAG: AAA family ATPase [bacterium]|nr:AAA family ATPase [bacterium]